VSTEVSALVGTHPSAERRWPSVSVIIPTRNRAGSLRQLLEALSTQVYPSDRLEVIVVDNSSTDNTEKIVREAGAWDIFPVRYLRKEDDGPAASRNRGAEMATGEILAFTDSDCIPTAAWVRSGISAFDEGVGLVCGPVEPVIVSQDDAFFSHQIYRVAREDGLYATANVFYRRDVFLELGGFIETMRTYAWGQPVGGDDTEFGWRVRRAGYQSVFAPGAVVCHLSTPISVRSYLLQPIAAQVIPKLVAAVPELRKTCLYRGYFIHRQSATFYLLLLGLALGRATPWAALLALPWLREAWPAVKMDVWPPKRWGRAAMRLALRVESSSLLSLTLALSSIRNRSLVL
jgi:glycosyltransferase involved in cell wall biosynthesis